MKVEKFSSLKDLEGIVDSMDTYRRMPLYAEDEFGKYETKHVYGIVNTTTRKVVMPCGPEYPVFGHHEAYGLVINELKEKKIDVHGRMEIDGDRSYCQVLFNDVKVIKDDRDGIELGISFKNPMDRKTSFKGNGYTWRQFCSNGAGMKTLLPQLEVNERHVATMLDSLPAVMRQFVEEATKQTTYMQTFVDQSMKSVVKFETREQLEATMELELEGVAEKHARNIIRELRNLQPTRWELFNAVTFYSSHSAISVDVRERLDTVAERLINMRRNITPVQIIKRVTDGE